MIILSNSCATYYQKSSDFQVAYVKGDFEGANKILDQRKKAATDINRLLFFLQKGCVFENLKDYETSNQFFENAFLYTEDFKKNFSKEAASILTNPTVKAYVPEDHESVLVNYFKAINYLRMDKIDEALVEARRINNRLNQLNDRYEKKKNRYKSDAFAQNLMGICFEKNGEYNDAFIAYRNAYNTYEENYSVNFGVEAPLQLKKDLLRMAKLIGFNQELSEFEEKFKMKAEGKKSKQEAVIFWHNGLGPIKSEWSINFLIVRGKGGGVIFVNEELGLSFPFPLPAVGNSTGGLGDLKFVRIAFPKYLERKPLFQSAQIILNDQSYNLELGENINQIAFKTLEDRMLRELANSLMRLAIKQAAEYELRQKNQNLGALLSVMNAVSEKADTRNWQTLPYSISYCRIPLDTGINEMTLQLKNVLKSDQKKTPLSFTVKEGETVYYIHHNMESQPLSNY